MNKKWVWLNNGINAFAAEARGEYHSNSLTEIRICADCRYILYVNGKKIGKGPVSAGSDFLNGVVENTYFDTYEIKDIGKISLCIEIQALPTALCQTTFNNPGLYLEAFENSKCIFSAEDLEIRELNERVEPRLTDYTKANGTFQNPVLIQNPPKMEPSQIKHLVEEKICPVSFKPFVVNPQEKGTLCLEFDKIYSAYCVISIKAKDRATVKLITTEQGSTGWKDEAIVTNKDVIHTSYILTSVGEARVEVTNQGNAPVIIDDFYLIYTHYPVSNEAGLKTSNKLLNDIYDLCIHTLKICRQDIHLDSPTHKEHLACTGDYYIQALIEYLNMYDPTLTAFDIYRTSKILECQDGRLFHTTYSLIYPMWIYDYYMHTGDISLVQKCEKSLRMLIKRFEGYVAKDNGLLEYAPDYMFVDWVVASSNEPAFLDGGKMMSHGKMEGFSLHHPPKSLGQSVLCMFYYQSLLYLSKILSLLGDENAAKACGDKAHKIKESINTHLFDKERGLYIGGLNTENRVEENAWLPKNNQTVYYLKQANILAVLYDIAPKEKHQEILEYVIKDLNKYELQPYFYHFLLEALYKADLFERHGLELISRYKVLIDRCNKGLSEAWENMDCDFSHAWGATPAYILKKALSGLEILEPGYKRVRLRPQLFGLELAKTEISTPYGKIEICQKKGEGVSIKAPKEIKIVK
ncbi:MAG: hypothetical protein IKB27_04825 [Clostridia bacterium]|nr:hypothetical protein [Clostridia bacterium]